MKVALTFARMNPMTIGHMKVVDILDKTNADKKYVYLSHSFDKEKNPLPYWLKASYIKTFIKDTSVEMKDSEAKTVMEALKELKEFNEVILVIGDDRFEDFKALIEKYNGVPDKKGNILYDFDRIDYINAGQRQGNDIATNASATKARNYVKEDNFEAFKEIIPGNDNYIKEELFNDLKEYMGL